MEVRASGDEELGEFFGGVGPREEGGGEAWPEGEAGEVQGGEGAGGGAGEGVVDGGGEARPEVGGFLGGGGGGEGRRGGGGEDGGEFGLGVVGEVDVRDEGGAQEVGRGGGYDEDCGEGGDLERMGVSSAGVWEGGRGNLRFQRAGPGRGGESGVLLVGGRSSRGRGRSGSCLVEGRI